MIFIHKKIKSGKKHIDAFLIKLLSKNFILFRGSRGYIMCGYLNLKSAAKFKDVAAKIVGVSTIPQALRTDIHSVTSAARRLGIYKDQPVREALKIIA